MNRTLLTNKESPNTASQTPKVNKTTQKYKPIKFIDKPIKNNLPINTEIVNTSKINSKLRKCFS